MFLWSLWSEAGTEETFEESMYLREQMAGRSLASPGRCAALWRLCPLPLEGTWRSSDLIFCAVLGFHFASRLRGGGLAFGRSDYGQLLHLETVSNTSSA